MTWKHGGLRNTFFTSSDWPRKGTSEIEWHSWSHTHPLCLYVFLDLPRRERHGSKSKSMTLSQDVKHPCPRCATCPTQHALFNGLWDSRAESIDCTIRCSSRWSRMSGIGHGSFQWGALRIVNTGFIVWKNQVRHGLWNQAWHVHL